MGFPDNYTNLTGAKKTDRYQGTGRSWAVPVVTWIGERLIFGTNDEIILDEADISLFNRVAKIDDGEMLFNLGKDVVSLANGSSLNCTAIPEKCSFVSMKEIVSPDAPDDIYISPVGGYGMVRRKMERNRKISPRLGEILLSISSEMSPEEIEKRSRIQHRGRFSSPSESDHAANEQIRTDILKRPIQVEKAAEIAVGSVFSATNSGKLPEEQCLFWTSFNLRLAPGVPAFFELRHSA